MSKKQKHNGFTIVELLIVIVVIAIMAGVVFAMFNGATKRAKDAERMRDIDSVSKALVQYRILNLHYPRYDDVASNTLVWVKANFPGIQSDAFVAPGGTDANSFGNSTAPAINLYSYRPYFDTPGTGTQTLCTQANLTTHSLDPTSCDRYELRWRSEVSNSVTTFKSRYGW